MVFKYRISGSWGLVAQSLDPELKPWPWPLLVIDQEYAQMYTTLIAKESSRNCCQIQCQKPGLSKLLYAPQIEYAPHAECVLHAVQPVSSSLSPSL